MLKKIQKQLSNGFKVIKKKKKIIALGMGTIGVAGSIVAPSTVAVQKENDLKDANKKTNNLKNVNEKQKSDHEALQTNYETLQEDNLVVQNDLEQSRILARSKTDQNEVLEETIDNHHLDIEEKDRHIASSLSATRLGQENLRRIVERELRTDEENKRLKEQINNLRVELDKLIDSKLSNIEDDIETYSAGDETIQLKELKAKIKKAQETNMVKIKKIEKFIKLLQSNLIFASKQTQSLDKDKNDLQNQIIETKNRVLDLENENKNLRSNISKLEGLKLSVKKALIDKLQEENEELKFSLRKADRRAERLEKNVAAERNEWNLLMEKNNELQAELDAKTLSNLDTKEINELKKDLDYLKTRDAKWEAHAKSLRAALQRVSEINKVLVEREKEALKKLDAVKKAASLKTKKTEETLEYYREWAGKWESRARKSETQLAKIIRRNVELEVKKYLYQNEKAIKNGSLKIVVGHKFNVFNSRKYKYEVINNVVEQRYEYDGKKHIKLIFGVERTSRVDGSKVIAPVHFNTINGRG